VTRTPIYAHDFASVPSRWEDVSGEGDWARNTITVLKNSATFDVSRELLEDGTPDYLFQMLREPTWEERARAALYRYRLSYRLRVAWLGVRLRLSDAIYPREYRDD